MHLRLTCTCTWQAPAPGKHLHLASTCHAPDKHLLVCLLVTQGLQSNDYYATVEGGTPLELDQLPNDFMALHPDSFSTAAHDPAAFQLPSNCAQRCPLYSICTVLRARAALAVAFAAP